eukprot:2156563-Prymnesium_polylepis.1
MEGRAGEVRSAPRASNAPARARASALRWPAWLFAVRVVANECRHTVCSNTPAMARHPNTSRVHAPGCLFVTLGCLCRPQPTCLLRLVACLVSPARPAVHTLVDGCSQLEAEKQSLLMQLDRSRAARGELHNKLRQLQQIQNEAKEAELEARE